MMRAAGLLAAVGACSLLAAAVTAAPGAGVVEAFRPPAPSVVAARCVAVDVALWGVSGWVG